MNKAVLFYAIVLAILAGKVVTTIYQGSMIVNHGSKIAQLQQEKLSLQSRKTELRTQLAQANSLHLVMASEEFSSYTPIVKPITLGTPTTIAVSQ